MSDTKERKQLEGTGVHYDFYAVPFIFRTDVVLIEHFTLANLTRKKNKA